MQSEWNTLIGSEVGTTKGGIPFSYQQEDAGHWSVPWADLMMVMFVLFVVLYVFSVRHENVVVLFSDRSVPGEVRVPVSELDVAIGRMARNVHEQGMPQTGPSVYYKSKDTGVSVVREKRAVRVTLRGELFFESGSAALRQEAQEYLAEVADVVRITQGNVDVIGYADSSESSGVEGFQLTSARAAEVVRWFVEGAGVAANRFTVVGRSDHAPELPTLSQGHETANRRVEIVIHTDA